MAMTKQSEHEQKNEINKLKEDIKKVEKAKADLDNQLKGMEMVLAKNAEMIIMFQGEAGNAQREVAELKKKLQ